MLRSRTKKLLLACAISSFSLLQTSHAEDAGYELLADTTGNIEQAVISINSARRAALRNVALISNIVNGVPARIHFSILTNDRQAFTIASNPQPERIQFLELPEDNPITIWTQDPFLVLRNAAEDVRLLVPREFDRAGDRSMAARIASNFSYTTSESKLFFEGGNIVSDEEHIFVGADTIRYNADRWVLTEDQIVALFEQELGRRVLVVGPAPQPIGHIDMMLTPLGDGRVALADPAAGAAIIEELFASDPKLIKSFELKTQQEFFGAPEIERLVGVDGSEIQPPDLIGQTVTMAEASQQIAPMLDAIATALKAYGYEVLRVPFLYGGPIKNSADEGFTGSAGYPMLTYNNVLLENTETKKTVYLPQYSLAALDNAAAEAWSAHGFEVRTIPGLTISAMYGGALRCSVKVLERSSGL